MRDHYETKLTIAVADYLRGEVHKGKQVIHLGVPFPDMLWAMIANEGRSAKDGAKFKRMGVRRGMSDFIMWYGKNSYAIELKSLTGTQSPYQRDFQVRFEQHGGKYAICRTVAQLRDQLIAWGIKCHNSNCIEPSGSFDEKRLASHDFYKPRG